MRARVVASAALAAIAALVLAGCNFVTPMATLKPYDASDGVGARVGDVQLVNVLVLTEDGESGNLVFTAVNRTGDDVDLHVQYGEGSAKTDLEVEVAATGISQFGFGEGGQLFLEGIGTEAGSLLPIYFQYGSEQGKQLLVPVLDGSLEEYGSLLPTPTPTPEPDATGNPEPEPTETPAG